MTETIPALVWIVMPVLVAGGAGLLTLVVMQARMEVALAKQREALAEARALLATQHRAMAERIRATEESARRQALDDFMGDIRVEERQLPAEGRRLILAERVCFRNIPLTGWVGHEAQARTPVRALESAGPKLLA